MLPTFVIGLREGLEAALIVGIIAAFLSQQGRRDALRWMWLGVVIAISLCAAVAVALRVAEENLPQREQEQLETVIALFAVGMITWMIVWMRRHSSDLKGDLQDRASVALLSGGAVGLVVMAFLAVLREGIETAVFLLAAFQQSTDPGLTGTGAVLGIALAMILGYLIYRGGVKLNLSRVFRITGVVLVFVAAGLLAFAVHTAHEAGWWNILLDRAVDLRWLIDPGSVQSALITGMFGIQPEPTVGELLAFFLYAVPMTIYVVRPQKRPAPAAPPPVPTLSTN
ncbi:MAG TPA: iron uptake transporter permease EfeU [Acidimicrobiia bacterium]